MEPIKIVRFDYVLHSQEVLGLLPYAPAKDLYWQWQYGGSARSDEGSIEPLVAVSGDKVVGFNGVIAARLWVNGKCVEGAWSCDLVVAECARRSGIGRRLKHQLLEFGSLLLVSGASDAAARLHDSMGSNLSLDVRSFRRVVRPRGNKDRLEMIFQALQVFLSRRAQQCSSHLSMEDTIPGREELNGLWARCQDGYTRTVVRDARYLHWRYGEHPFARYRYLTARCPSGNLEAILVVREQHGTAHIVDYVGPCNDLSVKTSLVAAAVSLLQGVESWVTYTSDQELGTALRVNGFYQTRATHRFFVMASTSSPVTATGWFLMPGDSDGDMLRAARDHEHPGSEL